MNHKPQTVYSGGDNYATPLSAHNNHHHSGIYVVNLTLLAASFLPWEPCKIKGLSHTLKQLGEEGRRSDVGEIFQVSPEIISDLRI